jgi:hypothetical protein
LVIHWKAEIEANAAGLNTVAIVENEDLTNITYRDFHEAGKPKILRVVLFCF